MDMKCLLSLDKERQADEIHKNGVYVGKRKMKGTTMVLYQLEGFYVELTYIKYRTIIEKVLISDCPSMLDPYIDD